VNELLQLLPGDVCRETCVFPVKNYLLHFLYLLHQARQRTHEDSTLRAWRNICNKCNNSSLFFYLLLLLVFAIRYFHELLRAVMPAGTVANRDRVCFVCPNFHGAKEL